jgi:branched-chain amino acid transport system permease protein
MGMIFVILAAGLVLITSINKILFMAYGAFYTIGAYMTWLVFYELHLPYFASLSITILATGLLGMICYGLVFQHLQNRDGVFLATLIASMGLLMLFSQANVLVFGITPRGLIPTVFEGSLQFLGIQISASKIGLILISIIVTIALFLVYEKTALGRSMRAVAFLPEVAALQGINTKRILMLTLGIGTALSGVAGGLLAPCYGVTSDMGNNVIWMVLLLCMLGGMDSLLGAVLGGLVIGQILSFGQFFIGGMVQLVLFLVIGVVLYFKPAGLMGRGVDIGI